MRKAAVAFASVLLGACAGSSEVPLRSFDFGAAAPQATLPALRSVSVRAPAPFDGAEMLYRLAYRDGAELAAFAQSRWAAAPGELVRRHAVRALPPAGAAPCSLELEVEDFTQVFSAPGSSEARLELRASLSAGAARVAARGIRVSEPNAGPNAASGAAAMARAADRALGELSAWIGAQPACKA